MALDILSITLGDCQFHQNLSSADTEFKFNLAIVNFAKSDADVEIDNHFRRAYAVDFDLMAGVENPCMAFKCTFFICYQAERIELFDVLKDHIVVSHIIPYLREFVAGITSRSTYPTLTISPINTIELLERYHNDERMQNSIITSNAEHEE